MIIDRQRDFLLSWGRNVRVAASERWANARFAASAHGGCSSCSSFRGERVRSSVQRPRMARHHAFHSLQPPVDHSAKAMSTGWKKRRISRCVSVTKPKESMW